VEIRKIVKNLKDTLEHFRRTNGFGRGISAPQIGTLKRIICMNVDKWIILINPIITGRSRETMRLWDDCFSFPEIMVKVKRFKKIRVRYCDESMKECTSDFIGDWSELVQHEIDHLDGILAIDRAIDSKHIILRSEWKKRQQNVDQLYVL
jgi:peptide deformylase